MSKKRNAWNALPGSPYARTYSMFTGDAFHAFPNPVTCKNFGE